MDALGSIQNYSAVLFKKALNIPQFLDVLLTLLTHKVFSEQEKLTASAHMHQH